MSFRVCLYIPLIAKIQQSAWSRAQTPGGLINSEIRFYVILCPQQSETDAPPSLSPSNPFSRLNSYTHSWSQTSWQPGVQSNRFGFWNSEGGIEFVFYYLGKCSHCSEEEVGNSAGCFKKTWCWMVL